MFSSNTKATTEKELLNSSNIIGKGTHLEGNLTTAGNLRLEGKVVGSIHTQSKVVLGGTSVVEGNITAQNAEIGGSVHGTIGITGLLILKPTAVIDGDITTNKLVFEEGAKFNGKCNMNSAVKEPKISTTPSVIHQKNTPLEQKTQ